MSNINLQFLFVLKHECTVSEDGHMKVLKFCMDEGLITDRYVCPQCEREMKLVKQNRAIDKYEWQCRVYSTPAHQVARSVRKGSWFERSKIAIVDVLLMTEFFVMQRTQSDLRFELGFSERTVCDWRSFYREVCMEIVLNESSMLGGFGKIVEIDESKFGKKKYNRGKHENGRWVFGGVERGSNKCFFRVVETRDKGTLLDVIKTFILPGSTIYSDCWKSYDCLEDEGFQDLKVNHSLNFKDPETGVHNNAIEGTWSSIKRQLPRRTTTGQFDSYLAEYMWQRSHSSRGDRMRAFLEGVSTVYKPKDRDYDE
ncbi:uncharacterized protein isoform X1 [Rhodnius prolixus]|uniref:uncharacterized protein isoform X1 n=1 Tax=Rhodnius prolixus TaxID=13249 RepID=UPI003D1892A3